METKSFTPRFRTALFENVLVLVGMIIGVPLALLARSGSHRGMTITFAITWGLIGGAVAFLFYTVRFFMRAPKEIVVSQDELLLRWRNGSETRVLWSAVRRAVFRARWGYHWKFFLDGSASILLDDGLSATIWERISDLVEAQLNARKVPIERYDAYGKRVA
jgi:hypothetical protein